jgi:hypothetical protein
MGAAAPARPRPAAQLQRLSEPRPWPAYKYGLLSLALNVVLGLVSLGPATWTA